MSCPIEDLPRLYEVYQARYSSMDERHEAIERVVGGDLGISDPDEDKLEPASANFIQVAIEDTAEAAAIIPSVRVVPHSPAKGVKDSAREMEYIAAHYLDISNYETLLPLTIMRLAAYGLCPWVVWPDRGQNVPIIELRSPRGCWPEPGTRPGERARRVMFSREVYFSQLDEDHKAKVMIEAGDELNAGALWGKNQIVTLVELFDEDEILVAAIVKSSSRMESAAPGFGLAGTGGPSRQAIELERIPNPTGVCMAVVGARLTTDGQFRGQFDQVISPQRAHARLQALLLDYADQAVYSDIWVKDAIGEVTFGGGSYIRLGPQGGIGRVPPAVSSLDVGRDLGALEESVHLGGRWPKSRPGEIDQSIASAKFLEASAGMMNTVIKTYHTIIRDMTQNALAIMFRVDSALLPGEAKTRAGILRNQEFLGEYDTSKIDPMNRVRVEYGLGLGKDPSQSAVLHIQYAAQRFISKRFVMESIEGLTDVAREESRLDVEQFHDIAMAKILQGTQDGSISNEQILQLAKKREEGVPLFDLFEEFIVGPEREALANPPPGEGLPGLLAGAMPGMGGGGGAPPGNAPMPAVPGRPEPAELLARLGSPAGPPGTGSRIGTQVMV